MTNLAEVSYDPEFRQGAKNAVFTCLGVRPGERAVLITDLQSLPIGAALHEQFRQAGAELSSYVIEDLAARPLRGLPEPIARSMEEASVSCFAAVAQEGELPARVAMTSIVNRLRIRHAHMVNITPRIMCEGMRADFKRIDALSDWVMKRVATARELTASTPAGTRFTASFSPSIRWVKTSGIIRPEKWGNLPGGEVFTAPARIDGVFVADAVLGDWLANRYGSMERHPLVLEIEDSRLVGASCPRPEIVRDFLEYTSKDENSNRVGELALGTNVALRDVIGQILQDEKIPGMHIAFGHPYREHTGADWSSTSHIDVVGRNFDVSIDGVAIMKDSRFLVDFDSLPA
jgi:leucyl aminopeptidase (aminopeptidase T)